MATGEFSLEVRGPTHPTLIASASEVLYGSVIWDPLQLIDRWESRAASFFAAFSFALASELVCDSQVLACSSDLQRWERTFLQTLSAPRMI